MVTTKFFRYRIFIAMRLIYFQCDARSPRDQVQIGGSRGFDTTKLDVIDSICGIDSKPGNKSFIHGITESRLKAQTRRMERMK